MVFSWDPEGKYIDPNNQEGLRGLAALDDADMRAVLCLFEGVASGAADGYARMALVEERGELAVRGGIVDVFPPHRTHPIRIELLGDEVESIRQFDVSSQRSLATLREVELTALEPTTPSTSHLTDYLPDDSWFLVVATDGGAVLGLDQQVGGEANRVGGIVGEDQALGHELPHEAEAIGDLALLGIQVARQPDDLHTIPQRLGYALERVGVSRSQADCRVR